jgi:aminoglycoside 2'-N-acetyltransferase I
MAGVGWLRPARQARRQRGRLPGKTHGTPRWYAATATAAGSALDQIQPGSDTLADVLDVTRVHTADLRAGDRRDVRHLLGDAFAGDFSDEDWEHTLGGVHILLREEGELIGHVSVVQRRLLSGELSLRTGYVEALAVRPDRRRQGYGQVAMTAAEDIIGAAYDLGALSDGTGIEGFYVHRGWLVWTGPTYVMSPTGLRRTTDDDGGVLVFQTSSSPPLDLAAEVACDWRSGDVW